MSDHSHETVLSFHKSIDNSDLLAAFERSKHSSEASRENKTFTPANSPKGNSSGEIAQSIPGTPPPTPLQDRSDESNVSLNIFSKSEYDKDKENMEPDAQEQKSEGVEDEGKKLAEREKSSAEKLAESIIKDILNEKIIIPRDKLPKSNTLQEKESVKTFVRNILEGRLREALSRVALKVEEKHDSEDKMSPKEDEESHTISMKPEEKRALFDLKLEEEIQTDELSGVSDLMECEPYQDLETIALKLLERVLNMSIYQIFKNRKERKLSTEISLGSSYGEEHSSRLSSEPTYVELISVKAPFWPSAADFTIELGKDRIDEFQCMWNLYEDWLYCTDFLIAQSDESSDFYMYESKWSIPTKPYPIPQAYASVYFVIEVSRVKPQVCPVEVVYVLEGGRYMHQPGKIEFREKWLFDIIDAKLRFYRRLKF